MFPTRPAYQLMIPILALLASGAGCDRPSDRPGAAQRTLVARTSDIWDARFVLERTPHGRASASPDAAPEVRGTLSLLGQTGIREHRLRHAPTHAGAYDIDFAPLGLSVSPTGVATLVAAAFAPDSLLALLPADATGGALVLRGVVAADSIHGTWSIESRAAGGWGGRFTLQRHERETPAKTRATRASRTPDVVMAAS